MTFVLNHQGHLPHEVTLCEGYNTFRIMNMKPTRAEKQISRFLQSISSSPRLQILLAIGEGEACVCHLETMLGHRQAYISQHLMALRQAKIVTPRREGRNIFYRLTNPDLLTLIRMAGKLSGIPEREIRASGAQLQMSDCLCPHCSDPAAFVPSSAIAIPTV